MSETPSLCDADPQADPWNTALLARAVVKRTPKHHGAWGTLGLCHAMLGNYAAAVAAYRRAHALAPENPWYAHNLGHLLDVALDRPEEALPLLRFAHELQPGEPDVVASLTHALGRCGELAEAARVLATATRRQDSREHVALRRWLEDGAPGKQPYVPGAGLTGHAKLASTRP